jgi:hypothetical protein
VLTGQAAGTRDDVTPPLYALPSFVRHLEAHNVDWRWYSFHPGTLRAADPAYASRTTSVSSKELFVKSTTSTAASTRTFPGRARWMIIPAFHPGFQRLGVRVADHRPLAR